MIIKLENEELDEFVYLGSVIIEDWKCMKDTKTKKWFSISDYKQTE